MSKQGRSERRKNDSKQGEGSHMRLGSKDEAKTYRERGIPKVIEGAEENLSRTRGSEKESEEARTKREEGKKAERNECGSQEGSKEEGRREEGLNIKKKDDEIKSTQRSCGYDV